MDGLVSPPLSPGLFHLIRVSYAVLVLGTLLWALPQARRFFVSDRFGGYAHGSIWIDRIQNPSMLPIVLAIWFLSALSILFDVYGVAGAFLQLLLCRYFFVHMRWKGVLRGMGAPGFMTYWLGAAVFFLYYAHRYAPDHDLAAVVLLAFRLDFAFIMLSAGLYKLFAGYARNEGMELGMVNPWWGFWWARYKNLPPRHWIFKLLNHLAWSTEVVAALLMLLPFASLRATGALLIFVSFVFIASHIRLGLLCETVMAGTLLFIPSGGALDNLLSGFGGRPPGPSLAVVMPGWFNDALLISFLAYIVLLPLAHAGLFFNFLGRRALPRWLQSSLERYTNFFGIIIWRVFSVDVVNFFVRVYRVGRETGDRREYTSFGDYDWASRFRYNHVGEFVCFASLFTTLKYYPSDAERFEDRLKRYAATIPMSPDEVLVFEYVSIQKTPERFEFVVAREFEVDVEAGLVRERIVDATIDVRVPHPVSPVFEGSQPGSYAPKSTDGQR